MLSVRSVRAVVREQNTCGLSVWERRASLGICERGRGFHLQRRDVSERLIGLIIQQAVVGVVALQCRSESRLHGEQQQAALQLNFTSRTPQRLASPKSGDNRCRCLREVTSRLFIIYWSNDYGVGVYRAPIKNTLSRRDVTVTSQGSLTTESKHCAAAGRCAVASKSRGTLSSSAFRPTPAPHRSAFPSRGGCPASLAHSLAVISSLSCACVSVHLRRHARAPRALARSLCVRPVPLTDRLVLMFRSACHVCVRAHTQFSLVRN